MDGDLSDPTKPQKHILYPLKRNIYLYCTIKSKNHIYFVSRQIQQKIHELQKALAY